MNDSKLPLLRAVSDAADDRALAAALLPLPDAIVLKYSGELAGACRRRAFEAGIMFVDMRVAAGLAVRSAEGLLPADLAGDLEAVRAALARFAAGG